MSTFLPLRLLNCSFPPLLLSSSKSGAFSPTSKALEKPFVNKRKDTTKIETKRTFLTCCISSPAIKTKSTLTIFREKSRSYLLLRPFLSIPIWGFFGVPHSGRSADTFSDCQDRSLSAVFNAELAEESFEVTLDRFPGHVDNTTDFLVVESLRDQVQYLEFKLREPIFVAKPLFAVIIGQIPVLRSSFKREVGEIGRRVDFAGMRVADNLMKSDRSVSFRI